MKYLQIFADKAQLINELPVAAKGELLQALIDYAIGQVDISSKDLSTEARYVWPVFRDMVNSCRQLSETRAASGRRGGKGTTKEPADDEEANCKQKVSKPQANDKQTPSKTDFASENAPKSEANIKQTVSKTQANGKQTTPIINNQQTLYSNQQTVTNNHICLSVCPIQRIPASREAVEAYCWQHGLTTDIDRFMSWNQQRNWPALDWHDALTKWVDRDGNMPKGRIKQVTEQMYHQRPDVPQEGQKDWLKEFLKQVTEVSA